MSYFKFTNEEQADQALNIINETLGLPINFKDGKPIDQNQYFIEKWNNKTKVYNLNIWYFQIPGQQFASYLPTILEAIQNKNISYEVITSIPQDWLVIEDDI